MIHWLRPEHGSVVLDCDVNVVLWTASFSKQVSCVLFPKLGNWEDKGNSPYSTLLNLLVVDSRWTNPNSSGPDFPLCLRGSVRALHKSFICICPRLCALWRPHKCLAIQRKLKARRKATTPAHLHKKKVFVGACVQQYEFHILPGLVPSLYAVALQKWLPRPCECFCRWCLSLCYP